MKPREIVILILGTLGFLSQIITQIVIHDVNALVIGGSLALLGVAPLLRLDERNERDGSSRPKPKNEEP